MLLRRKRNASVSVLTLKIPAMTPFLCILSRIDDERFSLLILFVRGRDKQATERAGKSGGTYLSSASCFSSEVNQLTTDGESVRKK